MDILYDGLRFFMIILAFIVITKIFMYLANWIGESVGIGKFVMNLLQQIAKFLQKLGKNHEL